VTGEGALRGRIALLVAVALAALTLRPQLVGLGPVLPRAQDALGISHSVAALLGAIPVIGMGVFAPAAAPLAARVGAIRAVTIALALIAGGGIGRSILPGAFAAIALTVPIGIGMGLGNALMVVAVKERFADRPVLVTGVYASGIQIGAAVAAGLSVPVADAGDSWRAPMLVFSVAAAASLIWWLAATHGGGPRPIGKRAHFPLRNPVAWLLVALFASTAFVYYGYAAWLPDAFTEHGWSDAHAGQLLLIINAFAIVTSVAVTLVGDRFHWSRRALLVPPCVFYAAGTLGIVLDPAHGLIWAVVTGCGNGAIFPLMMTLPLDAADRPEQVAGVVGMMLGIGYCIGALAPLALGALRDATGSFETGLWCIALAAVISLACGAFCSPDRLGRGVRHEVSGGA
jgi:CP family cyanate transporter-like MFS transporter